ncbi:YbjQ family protein [Novosphingobium percolationis]|uniref:YbjQ family protein n=1 Tax=Novosphingobium percolationis TaxID=2871811 RepID=UPI001CD1C654|nr:heavy metal-binding domain-containing protein [Novosphingobium percolationis]
MVEQCVNCDEKISEGGLLTSPNKYLSQSELSIINFVEGTSYAALCSKCGQRVNTSAHHKLNSSIDEIKDYLQRAAPDFPMLTVGVLPGANEYRALGMVTANIAVGTGFFNELSQGISDMFGAVNEQSGMALKVNKGEAAARGILVSKALAMGANAIIGVDVDYGVTNNNAATVNMQGTAIIISDPAAVLGEKATKSAEWIVWAWSRLIQLRRWSQGEIRDGEIYFPSPPQ